MSFNSYIEKSRFKPFSWGDHDCITFANNACSLQTGKGFADEFLGNYTTAKGALLTYERWVRSTDYDSLISAVDHRLTRLKTNLPPIGAIVAETDQSNAVLPISFGVCIGRLFAFVGDTGLVFSKPEKEQIFWGVDHG